MLGVGRRGCVLREVELERGIGPVVADPTLRNRRFGRRKDRCELWIGEVARRQGCGGGTDAKQQYNADRREQVNHDPFDLPNPLVAWLSRPVKKISRRLSSGLLTHSTTAESAPPSMGDQCVVSDGRGSPEWQPLPLRRTRGRPRWGAHTDLIVVAADACNRPASRLRDRQAPEG